MPSLLTQGSSNTLTLCGFSQHCIFFYFLFTLFPLTYYKFVLVVGSLTNLVFELWKQPKTRLNHLQGILGCHKKAVGYIFWDCTHNLEKTSFNKVVYKYSFFKHYSPISFLLIILHLNYSLWEFGETLYTNLKHKRKIKKKNNKT